MATMIPNLSELQLDQIKSRAEVKVYKALRDGLPESYVVFFEVAWIQKVENEKARDGETDFIICHPRYGYLCIEVKGGGVSYDATTNQWFSIDGNQQKHEIKDPISQVKSAKYSIRSKLSENEEWRKQNFSSVKSGHAIFLPDISEIKPFNRPDMPANLIGTQNDISNIKKWVEGCFKWWTSGEQTGLSLGQGGISIFQDIFAKSFYVKPLIAASLLKEEEIRLKLTNEQMRILDLLRRKRRVVVSGGAGTGKTILAVEKAKRLANEGFSTLLTCYNRPLANHLAEICKDIDKLSVMSFHQLCDYRVKKANLISGRDLLNEAQLTYPGKNEFDVLMPNALTYSLDILSDKYDAIVCDEGQDFREEFWVPLELLMSDYDKSPFYIFYDDNQNLYSRVSTFPIKDSESVFPLSINCRNTIQIHNASYKYYKGEPVDHSNLDGQEVGSYIANSIEKQAIKINKRIVELITNEMVNPTSISILLAHSKYKKEYLDILSKYPLPKNIGFTTNELREVKKVLVTTVNKFKGLESDIVFLWGMDYLELSDYRELLYVGLSRAKSILYIVGNTETCSKFELT